MSGSPLIPTSDTLVAALENDELVLKMVKLDIAALERAYRS